MSGKYIFVLLLLCFFSIKSFSANNITRTVSGVVVDAHTKEPLSLANVALQKSGFGQSSDRNGCFKFKGHIFSGDTLTVKYMGYESFSVPVSFGKNDSLFIKVSLQPLVLPMPEVSVAASRFNLERQLMALDPSAMHFTPADLEKLPSVAFADVYRALQKQPGITMTSEASPQIHIRGGNMDQNLVLLDGAPIYYPYHFLGISSSFNMDALDAINVSLGGFSTYFGNRLSSVLALSTKQPQEKFKTKLNLNIIGTDVTSCGKIGSKISWLGSFRASYFDIVEALGVNEIPYQFQDGIAKLTFNPTEKHHLQLTFFGNHDNLDENNKKKSYLSSSTDTTKQAFYDINRNT